MELIINMQRVTLNRRQMDVLVEFARNFRDVNEFVIESEEDSSEVRVKCTLFAQAEAETTLHINTKDF